MKMNQILESVGFQISQFCQIISQAIIQDEVINADFALVRVVKDKT